jgi:hypothetical protein
MCGAASVLPMHQVSGDKHSWRLREEQRLKLDRAQITSKRSSFCTLSVCSRLQKVSDQLLLYPHANMFASFSALASLLVLTSSANLDNTKMAPSLFDATAAEDDMAPFPFNIVFKFTDPETNKITGASKQVI